jgi:hypothetical protein
MKLRSFFYALAAGVSVLLLTSIAGFFWLTAQSPVKLLRGGAITNPSAAIFVPKQAPIVASLLVNPERLENFRQVVALPVNRRRSGTELKQLEASLFAKQGIDYRRDIRPWLGDEITVAVTSLDFDRNPDNSAQPGYLLAATTKNPQRAKEFLQLFYSKQSTAGTPDLVFEQYKGVNLIYKRPETPEKSSRGLPETLTGALVGNHLLFANHPKVLREAINNVQVANLSLNDDPVYQQKLETLTEPRIGLSFVNLPALAAWVSKQPAPGNDALKGSETLAVALSLNRLGLLAQTALVSSQPSSETLEPTLKQPVAALQYIPNHSLLALAGTDLKQFWNRLSTGTESNETLKPLIENAIASLQSRWDLDLPEAIFSWVQGEYAISALPRPDKTDPDWIFVAQKTPEANAQEAIEHLDTLAKQRGLSVGTLPLADKTITAWTKLVTSSTTVAGKDKMMRLEAQVAGCHATVGDYEIFTSSIEAMSEALQGSENSLVKNDNFKEAIAALPTPNDGYLYLDWLNGSQLVNSQLPIVQVAQLVAKPLFDHLRSLSISSYGINQGVQRSQLFFRLDNRN